MSTVQASPAVGQGSSSGMGHSRKESEPYYEDVDPRFAVEEPSDDGFTRDSALPNVLTPGGHVNPAPTPGAAFINANVPGGYPMTPASADANIPRQDSYGFSRMQAQHPQHDVGYLHPRYVSGGGISPNESNSSPGEHSLLEQEAGNEAGSERASEASHFTSISERPVNPNWRPGPQQGGGGGMVGSQAPQSQPQRNRQHDVILGANPDFSIPGVGAGRGGRQRSGSRAATASGMVGGGFTPGGRYPGDI